jgi:hypothetical protein
MRSLFSPAYFERIWFRAEPAVDPIFLMEWPCNSMLCSIRWLCDGIPFMIASKALIPIRLSMAGFHHHVNATIKSFAEVLKRLEQLSHRCLATLRTRDTASSAPTWTHTSNLVFCHRFLHKASDAMSSCISPLCPSNFLFPSQSSLSSLHGPELISLGRIGCEPVYHESGRTPGD